MAIKTCVCLLLLLGCMWQQGIEAATHVNISIAQQASAGSSDVTDSQSNFNAEHFKLNSAQLQAVNNQAARMAYGQLQQEHHGRYNAQLQQQQQQQQKFAQFRKAQAQKQQNQEFERYIQSYHAGPTVETVFETSSPAPARYEQSSSQRLVHIGGKSRGQSFERLVAAPSPAQINQADIKPVSEASQENITPSSVTAASTASGSDYDFANSYSNHKENFDQNKYNYDDQSNLNHELPPYFDDSQTGYYDSSASGEVSPHQGYLPAAHTPYQRPVVTKTIQIAHPALKAKKFEVRHPAIQKEFYDIEERVVIKPAGTIVVELERPVAKIPKGEAILPLGIPHPAVAGAYNNNGLSVSQTQSNSVPAQSQYSTTVGSAVTATPSYDQSVHTDMVDSKLRSHGQEHTQEQSKDQNNYFVTVEGTQGKQYQISNKNLTPKMFVPQARDDVDGSYRQVARAEVKKPQQETRNYNNYNQAHLREENRYITSNAEFSKPSGDDYFAAEYVDPNNRTPQAAKPARLMEAEKKTAPAVTTQIIKHEHNIHLPPSQHNIYLRPAVSRYQEEAARVLEIKPNYRQRSRVVLSVANKRMDAETPAQVRQTGRLQAGSEVQYSKPYAQMRYESAKLQELPKQQQVKPAATHIQIQMPNEAGNPIMIHSTIAPMTAQYRQSSSSNSEVETLAQLKDKPDCEESGKQMSSSARLVEVPANKGAATNAAEGSQASEVTTNVGELGSEPAGAVNSFTNSGVEVNSKSNSGHVNTGGSRVIAATPAPTDAASSSESFHKRRIVVNHPFQTVREVVEHEPVTNYHHVQVNQPALAPYYQMHDALRQYNEENVPAIVYPMHATHGDLHHYSYHHHV